jgi:ectoine hydroxylase-related dioxygenase (phytanoyl-CoA dioxygenase family)
MESYEELKAQMSHIIESINLKGFAVIRDVYSVNDLFSVKNDLFEYISKCSLSNAIRDVHYLSDGSISSVHNIIDMISSYEKIVDNQRAISIATACYGKLRSGHFNSSYFRKPSSPSLATKAHQDNAFFCMKPPESLTFWIPLTDVKFNSPVYYYTGSHKLGDLDHVMEGNLGASQCLADDAIKSVNLKFKKELISLDVGDCVVHNSWVVHGSEENRSGVDREAFNFTLTSINAIRDDLMYEEYQDRLTDFLNKEKSIKSHNV